MNKKIHLNPKTQVNSILFKAKKTKAVSSRTSNTQLQHPTYSDDSDRFCAP